MNLLKLLLFTLVNLASAEWDNSILRISSAEDLINVSDQVNSGSTFEGTTVLLDADIDFTPEQSKRFEPISNASTTSFSGTFDGQGYTISNLNVQSTTSCGGLFGRSNGTAIRNLIIDSSCSFESLCAGSFIHFGGVIGECYAADRTCVIESIVNMADVTFNGNTYTVLYLGGISGFFYSSEYHGAKMLNCANYGTTEHLYASSFIEEIGGIVGRTHGTSQSSKVYLQNCLSYGLVIHAGNVMLALYIGGIAGTSSSFISIDNCVIMGNISTNRSSVNIGSVIGCSYSETTLITNSYWTTDIKYLPYGYGVASLKQSCSFNPSTLELSENVSASSNYTGDSLVEALNAVSDYYHQNDFAHWVLNNDNHSVTLRINDRGRTLELNRRITLLPNLASEGSTCFRGWYTDSACTQLLATYSISSDTELYGRWEENKKSYTISFSTRGRAFVEPISAEFGSVVELPRGIVSDYCELKLWTDKYGVTAPWNFTVPAHDITLHSMWLCTRITTADDLVDFSHFVNSEVTDYSGKTIYLDGDIEFTEELSLEFEPIGKDMYNFFQGTFDGQGFTISNLQMNVLAQNAGLFGYSENIRVRNVFIDETCRITNLIDSGIDDIYTGGIIGCCNGYNGPCVLENNVNMGAIVFKENMGFDDLYMGGIAGYIGSTYEYEATIRNCANYRPVVHVGSGGSYAALGGIVGGTFGHSPLSKASIYNCLNNGAIAENFYDSGLSEIFENYFSVGGIVGFSTNTDITNCVNGNMIASTLGRSRIGSIVGEIAEKSTTFITHCYWTNETGYNDIYGFKNADSTVKITESYIFESDFELSKEVFVNSYSGTSLVNALNSFVDEYDVYDNFSNWVLNPNEHNVSFTINERSKPLEQSHQIILLPNIAGVGHMLFDGWYTSPSRSEKVSDYTIARDTSLFGYFENNTNNYTLWFNASGRADDPSPITARYLSVVTLPDISADRTEDGCTFMGWDYKFNEYAPKELVVPAHDVTLHALWLCTYINTPEEFIAFSRSVNTEAFGTNRTFYLGSDIDFSGKSYAFQPVGKYSEDDDDDFFFKGTFDGQGHVISNLRVSSDALGIGLFGYSSQGMTVQNVVIDSSCSFTGTQIDNEDGGIAGIVGYCVSGNASCTVRNSINMGSVSFSGQSSRDINIGGVVGYCKTQNSNCVVKNCVNYGVVSYNGNNDRRVSVGGIVGQLYSYRKFHTCIVVNSLNCGHVLYGSNREYEVYIGGVVGYSKRYNTILNCVNMGTVDTYVSFVHYAGAVVGNLYKSNMSWCYWNENSGVDVNDGYGDATESTVGNATEFDGNFTLKSALDVGGRLDNSLVVVLNVFATVASYGNVDGAYSRWILNKDNYTVSFYARGRETPLITVESKVILLPSMANMSTAVFLGWYKDEKCTSLFDDSEVTGNTTLYGFFEKVKSRASSGIATTVFIVFMTILITAVVVTVGFVVGRVLYKKVAKENELVELIEPLLSDEYGEFDDSPLSTLYPEDYQRVSLKKALINAGIEQEIANEITLLSMEKADKILEGDNDLPKDVTVEEVAAIVMYTMEYARLRDSPYKMINSALMAGTIESLEPIRDLLCLVMSALRKFPIVYGKQLYRGIRCDVLGNDGPATNLGYTAEGDSGNASTYTEGEEVVWQGISSTSQNISVTKDFLAKNSRAKKVKGTIFIIENGWGYDVHSCSMFPKEKEVILEPCRHFRVKSSFPGEGFTIINIEMLKTPLLLPEVLGTRKLSKVSHLFVSTKKRILKKSNSDGEEGNDEGYDPRRDK